MRVIGIIGLLVAVAITACKKNGEQEATVDTTMLFVGRRQPASWTDSVMVVVDAYAAKQITAQSAAKLMVSIAKGRSMNLEMDEPLLAALQREIQKRH